MKDQTSLDAQLEQWTKVWPKIVARAWSDDEFLARLVKEPIKVAEEEYKLPVFKQFRIQVTVGTSAPTLTLCIPPKPAELPDIEDLAKQELEGESCCQTACCTF